MTCYMHGVIARHLPKIRSVAGLLLLLPDLSGARADYSAIDAAYVTGSKDPDVLNYVVCLAGQVDSTPRGIPLPVALQDARAACEQYATRLAGKAGEPSPDDLFLSIQECGFRPGDASPDAGCGR